jgi:hypothetical protein
VNQVAVVPSARAGAAHVFAGGAGGQAAAVAAVIDPAFLAEAGWDPACLVLSPPSGHPLLGRAVCRVVGCGTTAPARTQVCVSCQRRLAGRGLALADAAVLPARPVPPRGPGRCAVKGCERERLSAPAQLCQAHLELRQRLGISLAEFTASPMTRPLPPLGPCAPAAASRRPVLRSAPAAAAHRPQVRSCLR